jgi:hypothetical protein
MGEVIRGIPSIGMAFVAGYRFRLTGVQMALFAGFHFSCARPGFLQ